VADQERLIGERDQAMMESSEGSSVEQARLNQLMQDKDSLLTQQQALQTDNDRVSHLEKRGVLIDSLCKQKSKGVHL